MAIEPSVVTDFDIEALLREKYDLRNIHEISILNGGISNCRKIVSDQGQFVLKEFPARFSQSEVEVEPGLTSFLRKHGVPVADFIHATDNTYVWTYHERLFHLQQYVAGTIFERNTTPAWFMEESALILGKIHHFLEGFPRLNDGMGMGYFNSWPLSNAQTDFANLIQAVQQDELLPDKERILADLEFKRARLAEVYRIEFDFEQLTFKNSHGDYKIYNLICGPHAVAAVIDFSSACFHPVIWEIIRSYLHADPECIDGRINIEHFVEYTKGYLNYGTLTEYDLMIMPNLFYYQQVRANYYNEYYYGHHTHQKGALDIARWSTNICRWLEENREELSGELVGLYRK